MRHHDDATGTDLDGTRSLRAVPLWIPFQADGRHDRRPLSAVPARTAIAAPTARQVPVVHRHAIPLEAEWTARHASRVVAAALLLVALAGTGVLGSRYYRTGRSEELTALVIGLAVVVVLWGSLIVATPRMVTLRGSVLTVWSGRDGEGFDLADRSQSVDLHGDAGSAGWALLLHRADGTACVLRRTDVDTVALDEIVRHYRGVLERRATDREARFHR